MSLGMQARGSGGFDFGSQSSAGHSAHIQGHTHWACSSLQTRHGVPNAASLQFLPLDQTDTSCSDNLPKVLYAPLWVLAAPPL